MRFAAAVGLAAALLAWAPAAPGQEPGNTSTRLKGEYKGGFRLTTEDGRFSLRLMGAIQLRYTFLAYDDRIRGNETDYSNFYIRRARLWWDGHAYDSRFTYYFHLQLEPAAGVYLHDAWLQYAFSPYLKLGMGRNKVPYGVEFLATAAKLNFIERSIMYGETDISVGAGRSRWPGGGNAVLGLSSEDPFTGFPTGGLCLYRSQGVSLSGQTPDRDGPGLAYEVGVWDGRNRRALSNADTQMLLTARLALFPLGAVDLIAQGDIESTRSLRPAIVASAYIDGDERYRDASGAEVSPYKTRDTGYNLALVGRYRGFSADLEWSSERYEMNRNVPGVWEFDRQGWRAALGHFVIPARLELVGRYAELERLTDPTPEAVANSGVGLVDVWDGAKHAKAMERKLTEVTAGVNLYLGEGHQHKVYVDVSLLNRQFAPYQEFLPEDQEDRRLRTMVQFRF